MNLACSIFPADHRQLLFPIQSLDRRFALARRRMVAAHFLIDERYRLAGAGIPALACGIMSANTLRDILRDAGIERSVTALRDIHHPGLIVDAFLHALLSSRRLYHERGQKKRGTTEKKTVLSDKRSY